MEMKDLINKYKTGSLTSEELVRFRKQLDNGDDKLITEIFGTEDTLDAYSCDKKETLSKMKRNIDQAIMTEAYRRKSGNTFFKVVAAIAAVVIPALVVLCVYIYKNPAETWMPTASMCTVTTGANEKSTVMLPDGSEVMMTGMSRLSFNAGMDSICRSIDFSGEAYFNISHDPEHPFLINTGSMIVKVYGTSFSLSAREGSVCSGVMLDKGSVEIISTDNNRMVKLIPGEMAVYNKKEATIIVKQISEEEEESETPALAGNADDNKKTQTDVSKEKPHEIPVWAFGGIKLNNVSPDSLIRVIEKTYNVKLNAPITDAITDDFTGTLPDNDLNRALYILSRIYRFDMPFTSKKEEQP